jgi:hypothetical protein
MNTHLLDELARAMMDVPAPLAELLANLETERSRLIELLSTLGPDEATRRPTPDDWSPAQLVDHLLLAEGFTNRLTETMAARALASSEATGFPSDLTAFEPLPPPDGMEAPPPIWPQKELAPAELIEALREMSEWTKKSFKAMATLDPRKYRMAHPIFGEIDLGQWWLIHPLHYEMHLAQSQEALRHRD